MNSSQLIGLNTKYYRYKLKITQEMFAEKINFKTAYISLIETGSANLTCKNIDLLAKTLNVTQQDLFSEVTAKKAMTLPQRIDMYNA